MKSILERKSLAREGYLSWDEYFMMIAKLTAMRSKDPNTQVGACIVARDNRILSIGYNGTPNGYDDKVFPWSRDGAPLDTKYLYVCHAELNAILNAQGKSLMGTRIYVALFPCNECAKAIIQSGIKEVIYLSDKYSETDIVKASKKMFESSGVKLTKLNCNSKKIELSFNIEEI